LHLAERYLNIPLDFFYELAKKINQLLPNNKINWLNTFMFISKIKYDHELNSLNQDDFEEDDNFSHALEDDEVEKELSNPSLFNAFKEGVIQRLIKEGVITDSMHSKINIMNEYYINDEANNFYLVSNGIKRKVTFAEIESKEWVYIYPTKDEEIQGVQIIRKLKSETALR